MRVTSPARKRWVKPRKKVPIPFRDDRPGFGMKRYIKAILGGILAVLAAVGWLSAIGVILASKGVDVVIPVYMPKWFTPPLLVCLVLFSPPDSFSPSVPPTFEMPTDL